VHGLAAAELYQHAGKMRALLFAAGQRGELAVAPEMKQGSMSFNVPIQFSIR
jgi:hypothetical protein